MSVNLRSTYRISEEYAKVALFFLFSIIIGAFFGIIYLSPTLVLGMTIGIAILFLTALRPLWSLGFLLIYLPLEPFILKWISDDIYLYARFFSEVLIYLLCFVVLWRMAIGKLSFKQTPIDIPFILFCIALLASAIINTVDIMDGVLGARQILRFVLLFFVTVYLSPSKEWVKRLLIGIFAIITLQIALGYGQALIGAPLDSFLLPSESRTYGEIQITSGTVQFWDPGQRVFGTLGRYDRLGTFLVFFLLIATAFLYEKKLKEYHRWLAPLFIIALPVLALTYSRSSWFGFLLGFFFIALWAKKDRRVWIGLGIALAIIALYLAYSGLVVNQLIESSGQTLSERFFEAFSIERWRGEYYGLGRLYWIVQTVLEVVPASPLFGHGPASYGAGAAAALQNTEVYESLGLPFGVFGTEGFIDNNWFSLWGEVGTIGLGIYLWMYIVMFFSCVKVWFKSKDTFIKSLALGVAAAMIAIALNAFLATFLEVRTLASYLWVFGGLVIAFGIKERILLSDS